MLNASLHLKLRCTTRHIDIKHHKEFKDGDVLGFENGHQLADNLLEAMSIILLSLGQSVNKLV